MKSKIISSGIVGLLVMGFFIGYISLDSGCAEGTDVSGIISSDTTWDLTGSPYIVVGDITVEIGVTLTIDPGVEVKFNGFYNLFLEGTLNAIGTDDQKITITSNMAPAGPGDWDKIMVTPWGRIEMEYCEVSYGTTGIYLEATSIASVSSIAYSKIFLNKMAGIHLKYSNFNFISNNNLSNNFRSIFLDQSYGNIISGNIISNHKLTYYTENGTIVSQDTNYEGIYLYDSEGNTILGNEADGNRDEGIYLDHSSQNQIMENIISNSKYGIRISSSTQTTISDNTMTNCGIVISGDLLEHWNTHEIDRQNTVNGKPVYFEKNRVGGSIPQGAGEVILGNCKRVTVKNQDITSSSVGIILGFSSFNYVKDNIVSYNTFSGIHLSNCEGNYISGNTVANNNDGLLLEQCTGNYIVGNDASSNIKKGIFLIYSNGNYITRNTASNNFVGTDTGYGIFISNSNGNNIAFNYIFHNGYGTGIWWSSNTMIVGNDISTDFDRENQWGGGIHLFESTGVTIVWNSILKSGEGIYIQNSDNVIVLANNISVNKGEGIRHWCSDNVVITYNNLWDNGIGIRMFQFSRNILVHHNNIIGSEIQAIDLYSNIWDDGYPSGGNYWSDYTGVDIKSGPGQNKSGSDGIGDTPYVIDGDSQDNYPLMTRVEYGEQTIVLNKGWNLISVPLIQPDTNLEAVLDSIDGAYDAVQWFDPTDNSDHWKNHHTGKPPMFIDLETIDHTMGVWVHITEPQGVMFDFTGMVPPQNQNIELEPGWNLVGYPSLSRNNRIDGLNNLVFDTYVNAIWTFDSSTQLWKEMLESDYFEPGTGYWVHAIEDCVWEVPL